MDICICVYIYSYHMMRKIVPWLRLHYKQQEFIRETAWNMKNNAIHHMNRLERKNCMISIGTKKYLEKIISYEKKKDKTRNREEFISVNKKSSF